MEDEKNKKIDVEGLLPPWHKRSIDVTRSTTKMAPPSLPPLPTAFRKSYLLNDGGEGHVKIETHPNSSVRKKIAPSNLEDEKKPSEENLSSEAQDLSYYIDPTTNIQIKWGRALDPNMDPKKLKRIISNRLSAQKSRVKKYQYVSDMERKAQGLEAEIAVMLPQIEFHKNQQMLLEVERNVLIQRLEAIDEYAKNRKAELEETQTEYLVLKAHLVAQQVHGPMPLMPGWEYGFNVNQMGNQQPGMEQPALDLNSFYLNPTNGF